MNEKKHDLSALHTLRAEVPNAPFSPAVDSLHEYRHRISVFRNAAQRDLSCVFGYTDLAPNHLMHARMSIEPFLPPLYVPKSHDLDIATVNPFWRTLSAGMIPERESCKAVKDGDLE